MAGWLGSWVAGWLGACLFVSCSLAFLFALTFWLDFPDTLTSSFLTCVDFLALRYFLTFCCVTDTFSGCLTFCCVDIAGFDENEGIESPGFFRFGALMTFVFIGTVGWSLSPCHLCRLHRYICGTTQVWGATGAAEGRSLGDIGIGLASDLF